VPEVFLNQPGVVSLVGQRIAAGVLEHVRMHLDRKFRFFAGLPEYSPHSLACDRGSALRYEQIARGLVGVDAEPAFDQAQLVALNRMHVL